MSFKPLKLAARRLKTFPPKAQKRRRIAGAGVLVAQKSGSTSAEPKVVANAAAEPGGIAGEPDQDQ